MPRIPHDGPPQTLTLDSDNCRFAQWVHENSGFFCRLARPDCDVIVFGEWCGKGIQKVVLSQHPIRSPPCVTLIGSSCTSSIFPSFHPRASHIRYHSISLRISTPFQPSSHPYLELCRCNTVSMALSAHPCHCNTIFAIPFSQIHIVNLRASHCRFCCASLRLSAGAAWRPNIALACR